ncbi:phosphoglycerate dehydrogenase [Actinomycetospora corticicola]|uniref:D-3-phosphoglycerate dehydrogenase n=1 Tax=Actinomycetospora corticicola TaxID=663602 RepID=A0A7Y9DW84_9PSEU|nr:phosphoglycerate dehydrogenase [Actinomycetospora corticicola]NYD36650.1 D-3-phosphoglycerate dehydrogenase [Actinomycetospora corticicola]
MSKPVVLMAEKLAPSTLEVFGDEVEVRQVDGTDRAALLEAVADADALLVRSATQVDAEVFAAQKRLTVVGRAGVGLDNVDVPSATAAGVMVVNAPTSNIVSAAEHALALLLATARHIPAADAALRRGEWARSRYSGVEIQGKTVGVIGLGKIGQLFASRIKAFDTHVIAYDPYLPASRAAQLGIELVELDELLARADMMTIHLPKTPETQGLIGKEALARTKPGVIVINAARGGLVDEDALAEAIRSGHVAGAGVDVYVTEPTTQSPLFELEQVTATPHLGASTAEAQDRAGTDVAHSVLKALRGDFVPDAVNVQGGAVGEEVRPWLGVTQKLGTLLSTLVGQPESIVVEVRGELGHEDVGILELAALRGVFGEVVDEPVTFVNAPALAAERGVSVAVETATESPNHRSLVTLRAGDTTVSGTLTGTDQVEKLVEINGRSFDLRAEGHVLLFEYTDRPGAMGQVGTRLGESGVNIEAAQLSQTRDRGSSLMLLRVDRAVPEEVLAPIGTALDARTTRMIPFG